MGIKNWDNDTIQSEIQHASLFAFNRIRKIIDGPSGYLRCDLIFENESSQPE